MKDEPAQSPEGVHAAAAPAWGAASVLLAMLAATTILSQFFRASTSIIGPELIRDLDLSSQALGFANGSFFLALLVAQVPVGMAFDRIGPRVTVASLSVLMVAGALLHGLATSGAGLTAARFLVGLGCAGSFMSGVVLISRWYPRAYWSTAMSWLFALSQIGIVLAGPPLAAAAELIGWRSAFIASAALAALVGVLFLAFVRDRPPGAAHSAPFAGQAIGALAGLRLVLATPNLLRVLSLFMVAYATFASVQVLWAGPYLNDVYGLGPLDRGSVLLAMAAAQTVGTLLVGPLDRVFNTRKWVAAGCAALSLATLIGLAALPLSLPMALACLMLLSAASGYGSILLAHIRSHFPDHLAGRGATTANMAQLVGATLLPMLTGLIPPLFPGPASGYSAAAYQAIFATLALALAAGLAVYLTARDARPRSAPLLS